MSGNNPGIQGLRSGDKATLGKFRKYWGMSGINCNLRGKVRETTHTPLVLSLQCAVGLGMGCYPGKRDYPHPAGSVPLLYHWVLGMGWYVTEC